jgi:hypothetical protein
VLIKYLNDFYIIYINDILIYSKDPLEYELYIKKILEYLKTAGLQADIRKSEFSVIFIKFLGFIISIQGIVIDPEKVAVIRN